MRVLIVDDNPDNLYLLETLLKGNGYEILMASNGLEALELLRKRGADLIVSDILMPKMDGFQLCREVRADEGLRDTPFVFYTATYTTGDDEKFALGLGADRFILKPTDPELFLGIIADVLQHAQSGQIAPSPPLINNESYFPQYSSRLKEKLETKMEQIRESERRYRNLFNSLRDVVIISDLEGLVLDVNQPALRNTFGYETNELMGSNWRQLYAQDGNTPAAGVTTAGAGQDDGKIVETMFRTKDGTVFHGELSLLRLVGDDGMSVGTISVIRDISQQKMLESLLHQAQKMEAMGRLAGGVAHDFNNYLTVIIGFVDILKRRSPPWEEIEEMLNSIRKAAVRSHEVTRQLLAFSRKEVIDPVRVDLNSLIEEEGKNLARLIGEDIDLEFDFFPALWPTKLDPTQFDQIIMNLALNARDAMSKGGRVCFTTRNVCVDAGTCAEHPGITPGGYVQLQASDNGCGMDQETLKHIFEPFFTTKEAGKGTGLGLATIYGIVTQNRGFIRVVSRPGQGTDFIIYFPRAGEDVESRTTVTLPPPAETASGTILLVEDDDGVREVTAGMLQTLGYRVIEKGNPGEAIAFCSGGGETVDLVLTDAVMPTMSGREMIRRIEAATPGIAVLYMSGYASDMTSTHGIIEAGVHFIRKPFDMNMLNEKLLPLLIRKNGLP